MIGFRSKVLVCVGLVSGQRRLRLFLFPQEKIKVKELTDEQKLSRAERARRNGQKSKGPVTPDGKYRSSMNAIATGEHVELHKEDLPPFFTLLTTDDRHAYVRSHQSHMRKFRPDSELEGGFTPHKAVEPHSEHAGRSADSSLVAIPNPPAAPAARSVPIPSGQSQICPPSHCQRTRPGRQYPNPLAILPARPNQIPTSAAPDIACKGR